MYDVVKSRNRTVYVISGLLPWSLVQNSVDSCFKRWWNVLRKAAVTREQFSQSHHVLCDRLECVLMRLQKLWVLLACQQ